MGDTIYDDYPHPVPLIAYLRYKENWLWHFMDKDNQVYGMAHFSYEPLFNRARMSCNIDVKGTVYKYSNEIPFPENFAYAHEIGDGKLKILFKEPQKKFELHLTSDDLDLEIYYEAGGPMFDFVACEKVNPDRPHVFSLMNLNTHQMPPVHQQQILTMTGKIQVKNQQAIVLSGCGNRDHSQGVRCDTITRTHSWSWLLFTNSYFSATDITVINSPSVLAADGYMHDRTGLRALKEIDVQLSGATLADGMPETVRFLFEDIAGNRFTIVASIVNRLGVVPLSGEKPDGGMAEYICVENFCQLTLEETGETGYGMVQLGYNPAHLSSIQQGYAPELNSDKR
jgi:hypothetical protein